MKKKVKSLQLCPTLCDPMVCSPPSSMGFSRQEYWSGLFFPSPGDFPNPGIEPRSPILQAGKARVSSTLGGAWAEPRHQWSWPALEWVGASKCRGRLQSGPGWAMSINYRKWCTQEQCKAIIHAMQGHPWQTGHSEEFWQNVVHWRRKLQPTPIFLPWELTIWKDKNIWHQKISLPSWKVSSMILGKSGGQLPTAPVRMKQLGQSRNDAQVWMYLVVKVKFNAVKNNITLEPGMLGSWIKINWAWSQRR